MSKCRFSDWFKSNGAKVVVESASFDVSRLTRLGAVSVVSRVEVEASGWSQSFWLELPTNKSIAEATAGCMIEAADFGAGSFSEYCSSIGADERDQHAHAKWVGLANLNDRLNDGFTTEALYALEQLYYHGAIDADDKENP